MNVRDLRDFIDLLEKQGELHSITAEVDPLLEIAVVTDRICKSSNNRALLFSSVKGSSFRTLTNLFGSERRLALALGVSRLADLTGWFDGLLADLPGASSTEKLKALSADPGWNGAAPEYFHDASQLHNRVIDLNILPIIKNHPLDGQPLHEGKFITLPLVITTDPEFAEINCGMYRAAATGTDTLLLKWNNSSGAAAHAASWAQLNKPMPVVIAIGGPPALTFAATLPLPAILDEFTFAGQLQGEPVKVFRCTNGLMAPVDAEIVIEGYLQNQERADSGAFGNHSGFYTPSGPASVVKVTSIRQRSDMILLATVVGRPPMEDCWLARGGGFLLFSLLKIDVPEVVALHYPFAGIFHGAVIISVKTKSLPPLQGEGLGGDGPELIATIRRNPWFTGTKLLIIVDEEQHPADEAGVSWRVMNSVNWERDMIVSGDRLSIDATRKPDGRMPVTVDVDTMEKVARRWREYGFTAE